MTINIPSPDGKRMFSIATNDPAVARATVRKRLAQEWLLQNQTGKADRPTAMDTTLTAMANGPTLGLSNVLEGGLMAGTAATRNAIRGGKPDFGAMDTYKAAREIQRQRADAAPALSGTVGLLAGLKMPGMDKVGDFVSGKLGGPIADYIGGKLGVEAPGFLKGLLTSETLPALTVRSAAAGVPLGAVGGAAAAKPGQELQGAVQGAEVGGVTGGVVPSGSAVVSRLGKGALKVGGTAVGDIVRGAANRMGLTRADSQRVAMQQLANALQSDKATPDQIRQVMNDWITSGASPPSVLNLASKLPSGGGNTRRLIMGASMSGSGSGIAGQEAEKVASAFPENADRLVRTLTPNDQRTAAQVSSALEGKQKAVADVMYPGPYAEQVPASAMPGVASAVADDHGAGAVRQAISEATARRDYPRVDRLTSLLKSLGASPEAPAPAVPDATGGELPPQPLPPDPVAAPPQITAGDLDRVKINMGQQARNLMRGDSPQPGVASGLSDRANSLDQVLENIPGISPARATFKGLQNQREAVDLGKGVLDPSGGDDVAKASSTTTSRRWPKRPAAPPRLIIPTR